MDKSKQKKKKWNAPVINKLSERYGLTNRFVRQCLSGERTSLTADTIVKAYKELSSKIDNILKS